MIAVSKDGTRISYSTKGTGPVVVLVDGALCYSAMSPNQKLADALSDYFTVTTYDRRCRGGSSNTLPYSVQREVEDLDAIIQSIGGKAFVYGISSGAALVLAAANELPSITAIATYEVPFIVDDSHAPGPADYLEQTQALVTAGRGSEAVKRFLVLVGAPAFMVRVMKLTPVWKKLTAVAHTLPYDLECLGDTGDGKPLLSRMWPNVAVPALVLAGAKSPEYMRNAQRAIAANLDHPDAYQQLDGQTHMVKATKLAPVLKEFFTSGISTEAR